MAFRTLYQELCHIHPSCIFLSLLACVMFRIQSHRDATAIATRCSSCYGAESLHNSSEPQMLLRIVTYTQTNIGFILISIKVSILHRGAIVLHNPPSRKSWQGKHLIRIPLPLPSHRQDNRGVQLGHCPKSVDQWEKQSSIAILVISQYHWDLLK